MKSIKWLTTTMAATFAVILLVSTASCLAGSTSDAADWLQAQQDAAGWFPWTPSTSPPTNTQGPSGMGMLNAYLHTKSGAYLLSATENGDYMLNTMWVNISVYTDGDPRFATHDPLFMESLSLATANSQYADFVQVNFWDKLSAGTYGESNNMGAAEYGAAVVNGRASQGIVEMSPWDLSATAIAAHLAGEDAICAALMGAVLSGLEATTAAGGYDVIGLAGAVWASAITGIDLDPTVGAYSGADSTADLAAALAAVTTTANDGAWLYDSTLDPSDSTNADTQTTAFAIAALNAFDRSTYLGQIARGVAFIRSLQQADGQFLCWPGAPLDATGSVEVNAEAISSIVYVAPPTVYVDDDFAGLSLGDDPAGDGVAVGYDAFDTIQEGVDEVRSGGTVSIGAGMYEQLAEISITNDVSLLGADAGTTILAPASGFTGSYLVRITGGTANLSNLTFDGLGNLYGGVRFTAPATGTVDGNVFTNIQYGAYLGFGLVVYADGVTVSNNVLSDIGRVGIWVGGQNATVTGNTYTGKGAVDGLDYGVEVGYGGSATISGNTITDCTATASSDGSNSAGILVTDYYGPGTTATIRLNVLENNTMGIAVGYLDTDASIVEAHYNSLSGNAWGIDSTGPVVDATLNWWGNVSGPSGEGSGTGDAVSTKVIFSPWLGTDPDGNPTTVGVQITGPMTIIVAPVGPEPTAGYLNTAIAGANSADLPFTDTIEVQHGAYDASTPITQPVNIVSQPGSAKHTTLNGNMGINSNNVLVGLPLQGFRINGNVTVGAGHDAGTSAINWCDLYGNVTNNGTGTFDAQYNYWGTQLGSVIDGRTTGLVDYDPFLPENADDSYLDATAIINAGLAAGIDPAIEQLWLMVQLGQDVNTFIQYQGVAGAGAFQATLPGGQINLGGAAGGGGAVEGGLSGTYATGDLIEDGFTITDPVTGEPIIDAAVTLSLMGPDGGLAYWGFASYDEGTGQYMFTIDTSGLAPGTYELIIQSDDGQSQTITIEIQEP